MISPGKLAVTLVLLLAISGAFLVTGGKAQQGTVYIYYVQTDRPVYELGQQANVTAAWYIDYDGGSVCSESIISCLCGQTKLASQKWLNEATGYHVHKTCFLLDPDEWSPGQSGSNGTAECSVSLPLGDAYTSQEAIFTVVRAKQNCSIVEIVPAIPSANASSISLTFRIYNANNRSFGVGSNVIGYNITNPFGNPIAINNSTVSDLNGTFSVSFNPDYADGEYQVHLRSSDCARYLAEEFMYTIGVGKCPIPTDLEVAWTYFGSVYNSTHIYALEPVRVDARLECSLNGTGIANQEIDFALFDTSRSQYAYLAKGATNSSGTASCSFAVPHEGEFVIETRYAGQPNSWSASIKIPAGKIEAMSRNLSIVQLTGLPSVIDLSRSYRAEYLVLDSISGSPVAGFDCSARVNGTLLCSTVTDNDGLAAFSIELPSNRLDLLGNVTLSIEANPISYEGIYRGATLSSSALCKIATVTLLTLSPQCVVESGGMLSIRAELLSQNWTPISYAHIEFMVFANQESVPMSIIIQETDGQGRCDFSLELSISGTLTVLASFNGNFTFDSSNEACSVSVVPASQARLAASFPEATIIGFFSIIAFLVAKEFKRKVSWYDLNV